MDIANWLRGLGLGQYEATFRDNAIEPDILADLTEADFEKLGIPLGHRKRLLKAIAALDQLPATPAPQPVSDAAERRQVTVMFCDLVGSTAMSTQLEPEDMRSVIGAYHRCCGKLVEAHGGFIAKYMGDGVLAYFGYPHAHEHDAERGVQTGLALVSEIPKISSPTGMPLRARVGLATGLVVVGDLVGSGAAQERGIVGETPNLAARLQSLADPDMVVVSESTRRLVGNLFELRDLGTQALKGIDGPVRAFAALRPSAVASRFEAMHADSLTALVGRDEELDLLMRRWSKAQSAEGQVVLVFGEAGIGKSHLTAALMEQLTSAAHTRLRYFGSPQHTESALHPVIVQLERAAGFAHDDTPAARLNKLDALLAQTSTSREDRLKLRVGSARDRRNDGVGKFPADRCADLDHLLAGPEAVEPSHQGRVQACRYRKRGGRNRGGGAPHVALACSFQHRFGHFLHEEGNAIGSLDDVLPDVRGKRLVADHPFDQRVDVALRQPIENLCCYPGPADPGRAELRARGHDQQHRQAPDPLDDAPKQLEACRIGPVRVLEDHQQRLLLCQRFHLGDERLQHALPSARRGKLECRIAAVVCEQQDVGDQARSIG
jgi:class 3 adenylate cyclase